MRPCRRVTHRTSATRGRQPGPRCRPPHGTPRISTPSAPCPEARGAARVAAPALGAPMSSLTGRPGYRCPWAPSARGRTLRAAPPPPGASRIILLCRPEGSAGPDPPPRAPARPLCVTLPRRAPRRAAPCRPARARDAPLPPLPAQPHPKPGPQNPTAPPRTCARLSPALGRRRLLAWNTRAPPRAGPRPAAVPPPHRPARPSPAPRRHRAPARMPAAHAAAPRPRGPARPLKTPPRRPPRGASPLPPTPAHLMWPATRF
jgi:hypothetical protein